MSSDRSATLPVLRAQDDSVRGHLGNGLFLLQLEQTAETLQERETYLAGARHRFRMALELIDDERTARYLTHSVSTVEQAP